MSDEELPTTTKRKQKDNELLKISNHLVAAATRL
jgi:hypothetical protein